MRKTALDVLLFRLKEELSNGSAPRQALLTVIDEYERRKPVRRRKEKPDVGAQPPPR